MAHFFAVLFMLAALSWGMFGIGNLVYACWMKFNPWKGYPEVKFVHTLGQSFRDLALGTFFLGCAIVFYYIHNM